jgi:predicted small metal-binding protein
MASDLGASSENRGGPRALALVLFKKLREKVCSPNACDEEVFMPRRYIDCREYPSEMNCTLAMSADTEDELLEAAVQHAVAVHGHCDEPGFREQLRQIMKTGMPKE